MVAVFIYELVVNAQAQGSPVSFHVGLSLLDLTGRSSIPILNAARRQPNVGAFRKCSDQSRRSFSAVYEDRFCCAGNTTAAMCASPCFFWFRGLC